MFWLDFFYPVTATTVYFNANITCSFTKKLQLLVSPRLPTGAPPLDPIGKLPRQETGEGRKRCSPNKNLLLQHCRGMGCRKWVPRGRGVDPYGTGGTCPPSIYEGGTSIVMYPPPLNILEVMSFRLSLFYPVTATTVYFNANIMCSLTKSFSFWG